MGAHHPECPERLAAIEDRMIASGLAPFLTRFDAPLVERHCLTRVHSEKHVSLIEAAAPDHGYAYLDPDTAMNRWTLTAARRAAGAAVLATDLTARGEANNVFCAVRPPGHHATRNQAMGFCFFNNVAVGAAHAIAAHGAERVHGPFLEREHVLARNAEGLRDIASHDRVRLLGRTGHGGASD